MAGRHNKPTLLTATKRMLFFYRIYESLHQDKFWTYAKWHFCKSWQKDELASIATLILFNWNCKTLTYQLSSFLVFGTLENFKCLVSYLCAATISGKVHWCFRNVVPPQKNKKTKQTNKQTSAVVYC